jgi:2-amino-4-hydroxy-6-hydroxymethyldihydropteridine diphosphokinase
MTKCLIALGSNLGDRAALLDRAVALLWQTPEIDVLAQSRWRETAPAGGPSGQAAFLNGAVAVESSLAPQAVAEALFDTENQLGRRREIRWGPRAIDLDLLLYGEQVIETPTLTVPHPRMAWRRFVLEPAAEIAAEMLHPTTGWTVGRLFQHLDSTPPYVAMAGPFGAGKTSLAWAVQPSDDAELLLETYDPAHLARFYANPPGNAWEIEVEFLLQRERLLAADSPPWRQRSKQARSKPVLSDFWFDQSLAYARVWLPAKQRAAFEERFAAAAARVVRPRLLVELFPSPERLIRQIRGRGRPGEEAVSMENLARIRDELRVLLRRPDRGPVLRLTDEDLSTATAEVVAAIEAMQ